MSRVWFALILMAFSAACTLPVRAQEQVTDFTIFMLWKLDDAKRTQRMMVSREKTRAVQEEVMNSPAVMQALEAQGIAIQNVINSSKTFTGSTVYYAK
jgi:hypothetical protein